jgi:hypothetical protein
MTAQFPAVVFPLLSSSDAMKELLECNNDTFPEHCALCAKQNGMKYLSISPCRYIYGRKSLKIPNFRFIIIYSMTVLSPTFSNKKLMGGGHPSFILSLSLLPPSCSAHIPRIIYFIFFYIYFFFPLSSYLLEMLHRRERKRATKVRAAIILIDSAAHDSRIS